MEKKTLPSHISKHGECFSSTRSWIMLYLYIAGIDFLLRLASSLTCCFQIHWGNAFLANIIARAYLLTNCLCIASAIILSIWIYQTSRNNRLAGAAGTFSPMRACAWWIFPVLVSQTISLTYPLLESHYSFIPFALEIPITFIFIVSFIVQYLILQELWKASLHPTNWKDEPDSPKITCWLVLNLFVTVILVFLVPMIPPWGGIIYCVTYLIGFLLMVSIMRTISSRQESITSKALAQ